MVIKLDWVQIWKQFNNWYNRKMRYGIECQECGRGYYRPPDLEEQLTQIQRIVNRHIAKIGVDTSNLSFDHVPNKRKKKSEKSK
ncbi:MAG: hypothetical protein ACXACY_13365 [Candidatus Hodarchaeales archaeon]|jgi:hypothetical protein